jgi:FKBP-type peptidyl-prolyl cis-trans isomerase FklB
MKKLLFMSALAISVVFIMGSCKKGTKNTELKTNIDSISYLIGNDIGKDFKSRGIEINPDALARGYMDITDTTREVLIPEQEKMRIMSAFQQELQKKQMDEMMKKAEVNKKEGTAFLAQNKTKPGVKVTASGLQYKIITEGTGKTPIPTDSVTVNYKGTLVNGTVFDNSYDRGQPASFILNAVIPGWTEGLQLLKEGGKAELYIPSELGYGDRGAGNVIPGGSALIFEVELLKVKAAPKATEKTEKKGKK